MSFVLVALAVVCSVSGQEVGSVGSIGLPHDDYKQLNGCVLPNGKDVLAFNESKSLPGVCHMVTCHEDGHTTYTRCIAEVLPDNCTLTEFNLTLSYPACCPTIICHNDTEAVGNTTTQTTTTTVTPDTNSTGTDLTEYNSNNVTTTNKPEVLKTINQPDAIKTTNEINNITNVATNAIIETKVINNETLSNNAEQVTLKQETIAVTEKPVTKETMSTTLAPVQDNSTRTPDNSTGMLSPNLITMMIAKLAENTTLTTTISPDVTNKPIDSVLLDNNATTPNKVNNAEIVEDNKEENKTSEIENTDQENIPIEPDSEKTHLDVIGVGDEDKADKNEDSSESSEIAEEVETTLSEKLANLIQHRKDTDHLRSELIIINFYNND